MTDVLDFDTLFVSEVPPELKKTGTITDRGAKTLTLTEALPAGSYPKYDMTGYDGERLPTFQPAFTPAEMLRLGVFGGNYFGGSHCVPKRDLDGLDPDTYSAVIDHGITPTRRNSWVLNHYGVKAGMDYKWWLSKGMIFPEDPLGWFHWFCRFHAGRRHMRDKHQITRHQNFVRWADDLFDQFHNQNDLSPIISQSLLQWSWHPRDIINQTLPPINN